MDERKLKLIEDLVLEASENKKNVLIFGEEGSGKEHTARLIHQSSTYKDNPFVVVNITTIVDLEKIIPYIYKAYGGTLYLDEIGDLSLDQQEYLIDILEKIIVESKLISDQKEIRIIASTTKDLLNEIIKGRFRKELYKILSQFIIELPALREMGEEIVEIAEKFIIGYCKINRKPLKYLSQAAKEILLDYDYPQNLRELKSIIELTIITSSSSIIYLEDVYLRKNISEIDILKDERTLEEYEKIIIEHFLKKYDNRVYYVAEKLGVSKNKIYNMINKGIVSREGL